MSMGQGGARWTRRDQRVLNDLHERTRFADVLDRFEAFARTRRASVSVERQSAATRARQLYGAYGAAEAGSGGGSARGKGSAGGSSSRRSGGLSGRGPRRPWSPPPQNEFMPPPGSAQLEGEAARRTQRRRAERTPVLGRKLAS